MRYPGDRRAAGSPHPHPLPGALVRACGGTQAPFPGPQERTGARRCIAGRSPFSVPAVGIDAIAGGPWGGVRAADAVLSAVPDSQGSKTVCADAVPAPARLRNDTGHGKSERPGPSCELRGGLSRDRPGGGGGGGAAWAAAKELVAGSERPWALPARVPATAQPRVPCERRPCSPRRPAPQVEIFSWQLVLGLCSTLFGAGFCLRSGGRR